MRLLLLCLPLALAAQDYDLLIRNGRVVDGTGNAWYFADIGVKDGRIAAMGRLTDKTAARTIDARGLIVAPGFIDIHNHSDVTLLADGNAESMIRQGVTSMIFGEGESAAPSTRWKTFGDYFVDLKKGGISTNIGSYVGSGSIWTQVHGPRSGPPTPPELDRMRELVRNAMQQGALGVSSSLSGPPGAWIDTATLVEMCKVAGEYGGIYSTHIRSEGLDVFRFVNEAIEIGSRSGVPVDVIHLKIAEHTMWGRMPELIKLIQDARARGEQVEAHIYPYRAGQNNLSSIIPPWAHEGGRNELVKRLQDPALRPRLEREILHGIPGWYNHYTATGDWEGMQVVSFNNPDYRKYQGKRMNEIIRALGKPPIDSLFQVLIDNDGTVPTVFFHHSEEDMQFAMRQGFVSFGSDGTAVKPQGLLAANMPHPRYYGTFPRILGRYVRDEKVITLEEAIRKMTSANANKIHIRDRGLLREGLAADITVFNLATIIDRATYENPHQYATGVEYVVVNGALVLDRGNHTGARPGIFLFGPGKK